MSREMLAKSHVTIKNKWQRLFRPDKLKPDNAILSEARKFVHQTYYYNVVSYIHIPLVP